MNREKAKDIMNAYDHPFIETKNGLIMFARQDIFDIEEIEAMSNDKLIDNYKGLVFINWIYGQVSLNDTQRIGLIELECDSRGMITEKFKKEIKRWYDETLEVNENEA